MKKAELKTVFLVHEIAYESQCDIIDEVSVFLTCEESREYVKEKAENFKHMKDFDMGIDEFSAKSSDGKWFYHTYTDQVPVKHRKVKNED